MNLNELKQKRSEEVKRMEAIKATIDKEQRSLSADEKSQWNVIKAEIEKYDELIQVETDVEEARAKKVIEKVTSRALPSDKESDLFERFDLAKALSEGANPTGAEAEMRQLAIEENKSFRGSKGVLIPRSYLEYRGVLTTSTGAKTIATSVANKVVDTDAKTIIQSLGVTRWDNLAAGYFNVPTVGDTTAVYDAENSTHTITDPTVGGITLQPKFLHYTTSFTTEQLYSMSNNTQNKVLAMFVNAIEKGFEKELCAKLAAIDAISGYATGSTFVTSAATSTVLTLESELAVEGTAYLTSPKVRGYLKGLSTDSGSGIKVWANNEVNGYPAYASSYINSTLTTSGQKFAIFGRFEDAHIGTWGGIQILMNEQGDQFYDKGLIGVRVSQMSDVQVISSSFKLIKNYPVT
ncbi:phage major capsid protein [uncultured Imperialibacter sp.]|uniref:phage major capsid protein n=1 Tax=uncultured Imperialibacter sp. TaxID=1672639 RepID=UPI0030D8F670|tara:strand:- start:9380 stop:10600 length:1221 start_codon:yes stop_codon:yes gene_type:complete